MLENELRIVVFLGIHVASTMMMGEHFINALLATMTSIGCYGMILGASILKNKTDRFQEKQEKSDDA